MAEARWPIRDSQPGIIAGNQAASDDQQKRQYGNKNGKTVKSGVIRRRGQNNSMGKPTILALGSLQETTKLPAVCEIFF